jgi:putative transposase
MADFEGQLLSTMENHSEHPHAWVILPNHYHFLVTTQEPLDLLSTLGKLHGRTSFLWNGADHCRGRKIWCHAAETAMKSERHFWATLNYIHHNPVKHGYVKKWQDWPFSSARSFLEISGTEEARRLWKEYPVEEYGNGWDE